MHINFTEWNPLQNIFVYFSHTVKNRYGEYQKKTWEVSTANARWRRQLSCPLLIASVLYSLPLTIRWSKQMLLATNDPPLSMLWLTTESREVHTRAISPSQTWGEEKCRALTQKTQAQQECVKRILCTTTRKKKKNITVARTNTRANKIRAPFSGSWTLGQFFVCARVGACNSNAIIIAPPFARPRRTHHKGFVRNQISIRRTARRLVGFAATSKQVLLCWYFR